jgi:hypothetical protein
MSNAAIHASLLGFVGVPVFLRSLEQKVFLRVPSASTGGASLTHDGQVAARAALGRLAQAAVTCRFCPVGPRGLEAVVRHTRECHPQVFYGTMGWAVVA